MTGRVTVYQASFYNPFQENEGIIEVLPVAGGLWRARNATTGTPFPGLTFGTAEAGRTLIEQLLTGWRWEKTSDWTPVELLAKKPMQRAEPESQAFNGRQRCIR